MSEIQIQKSILEYLGYVKNIYFFRAGAGAMKLDSGRYFKTGKAGVPDIVVCKDGLFYGLEVKTDKGKQGPAQKQAQKEIENAFGHYFIVRSVDDVQKIIKTL